MSGGVLPKAMLRPKVRSDDAFISGSGEEFHVNTVEGFWRLFKASIRSTHVQIGSKHMQRYLSEFTFRASNRERVNGIFNLLVGAL